MAAEKAVFTSGATSSKEKPRYDLIPQIAHELNARRFGYGAAVHGDNNYKKGASDNNFIRDRINHLFEHVQKLIVKGLDSEGAADDLGAILCNASILAELRKIRAGAATVPVTAPAYLPIPVGGRNPVDDEERDYADDNTRRCRAAVCRNFVCTRTTGHTGDHVAHTSAMNVVGRGLR